jgi:hypothetical protein
MLCSVETDAGLTGIGEGGSKNTLERCAGSLIGKKAFQIETLWPSMYGRWFYRPGYGEWSIEYLPECLDFERGRLYTNERAGSGVTLDLKLVRQIGRFTRGPMGRPRIGRR